MACFSTAVYDQLVTLGAKPEHLTEIDVAFDAISADRVEEIFFGDPSRISERERARSTILVINQGILHRAVSLSSAASDLAAKSNIYALALCVRGFVETTAQLGYQCHRLLSLEKGRIPFNEFHETLAKSLMGASHSMFESAPKPINVMTMIEKADKYFEEAIGLSGKEKIILDSYSWLSDFCHPNFLSSATSFVLDRERHTFAFQHDKQMIPRDVGLFSNFALVMTIFKTLWDEMKVRAANF